MARRRTRAYDVRACQITHRVLVDVEQVRLFRPPLGLRSSLTAAPSAAIGAILGGDAGLRLLQLLLACARGVSA